MVDMGAMSGLKSLRWEVAALAVCAALFAVTLWSDGVLVHVTHHDLWFMLDAFQRVSEGQRPHLDFSTPVGPAFYAPMALFPDPTARSVLELEVLVASLLLAIALPTLRTRLLGPLLLVAVLLVVLSALTPRKLGRAPEIYSHLALYNQWGFAALILIAVVALVPPRMPSPREQALTSMVVGAALAFLLLLKVTYFAGAAGLLGLGVVLRSVSLRFAVYAVAVFFFCLVAAALMGADLPAYWNDLRSSVEASANAPKLSRDKLMSFAFEGASYGLAVAVVFWLARPMAPIPWLMFWWPALLAAAALLVGGAVLSVQNNPLQECPLFPAAVLIAAELARRRTDASAGSRWLQVARVAPVLLLVGYPSFLNAGATVSHAIATHSAGGCRLDALQHTPGADVMFPPDAQISPGCDGRLVHLQDWETRYLVENAERLADGMALLRNYGEPEDVVFAFDFANPYPFLLDAPSPTGALIWWDPDRTFSASHHPDPERLFRDVDVLLTPHPGSLADYAGAPMIAIYGDVVAREFESVADGDTWRLWRRKQS